MARRNLDAATQMLQFKEKHGLDKKECVLSIINRLNSDFVVEDEAATPRLQQDIMNIGNFYPKITHKSMWRSFMVMCHKLKSREVREIRIPTVKTVGTILNKKVFSNNLSFFEDFEMLCLFFLEGGFEKFMNSSTDMERALLVLSWKYNIALTLTTADYFCFKPDIVTLPRIAASNPIMTVTLFHNGFGTVLIQPSQIVRRDVEWPRAFLCCMMAFMVPEIINKPVVQLLAVAVANDRDTKLTRLLRDLKAFMQSTFVENEIRLSCCREWGLMMEEVEEFIPAIKDSAMDCEEYIRTQRPDDPDLESVLKELSEINGGVATGPSLEPSANEHV